MRPTLRSDKKRLQAVQSERHRMDSETMASSGQKGKKRRAHHIDLAADDNEIPAIATAATQKRTINTKRRKTARQSRKECSICCDMVAMEQFPDSPHHGVDRDHAVCYTCWESHLHAELERKGWNELSCAHCGEVLELADIYKLDAVFEKKIEPRIMEMAAKALLKEDAQWIDCPSAMCRSGASMQDGHIFTCQDCHFRYCFSCEVKMHEGEACGEYQNRIKREPEKAEEEALSLAMVKKVSKSCPKCKTNLDKFTGCDHVTCKVCKYEFCWLCSAAYGGKDGIRRLGNLAHHKTCKYNSARLPPYPYGVTSEDEDTISEQDDLAEALYDDPNEDDATANFLFDNETEYNAFANIGLTSAPEIHPIDDYSLDEDAELYADDDDDY